MPCSWALALALCASSPCATASRRASWRSPRDSMPTSSPGRSRHERHHCRSDDGGRLPEVAQEARNADLGARAGARAGADLLHRSRRPALLERDRTSSRGRLSRLRRNVGARAGDTLVLTKAVGTGILTSALRAQVLRESSFFSTLKKSSGPSEEE